jgi:site-specific recombinase XerD
MCPSRPQTPVGPDGRRRSPITLPGYRNGLKPANAGKTYPAEVYRPSEVLALIAACPTEGRHRWTGVRNRALIALLWRSGLRIEEALTLDVKDVDLDLGVVHVLRGKGRKRRAVPIDRPAARLVSAWLVVRGELLAERADPELAGVGRGPLFCVLTRPTVGRRMHSACVRETLKDLARKARIERRVHPHGLRHTFASEVYFHEGAVMADVQLALGHAHASTTDRYIHRIAGSRRLLELLRDRPWPDAHDEPPWPEAA